MRFVEIKDLKMAPIAIDPEYVAFITHEKNNGVTTLVLKNDRRIQTKMFRSIREAVKWCNETHVDTSGIGARQG